MAGPVKQDEERVVLLIHVGNGFYAYGRRKGPVACARCGVFVPWRARGRHRRDRQQYCSLTHDLRSLTALATDIVRCWPRPPPPMNEGAAP